MMLWLALALGLGHCLLLSVWAATRLRYHLRPVAMSRYQPLPPWQWRLPSWPVVRRFTLAGAAAAAAVTLLVASYFAYENWRSQRAWRTFQTGLKQSGQSLSLASLLPAPAPDSANFARSPAFLDLLSKTNRDPNSVFERMKSFELPASGAPGNAALMEWSRHTNSPLRPFVSVLGRTSAPGRASVPASRGNSGNPRRSRLAGTPALPPEVVRAKRMEDAAALLQSLKSQSGRLGELATTAARLTVFQTSTSRNASAVLHPLRPETLLLERSHLLFQVRACASLALGRNGEAAEDVLTGLRLARLARQLPDAGSPLRVQGLLARSLQPLWEGLSLQAWTEPQLASFQQELAGFNLLADYTNAVGRVVLAQIELWRTIPDSTNSHVPLPVRDGVYLGEPVWQLEPRAWWYDSCIQLHNAGRNTIEQVDVVAGRIQSNIAWSDLSGLPLDSSSRDLLQQSMWSGAFPASVAFVQTSVNQATVACALERFRLANRVYPETLAQLVPALLARIPHDAVSGRPIIYQPVDAASFILRGVGPNGTDDRKHKASDDWLWTYPTNTPAAKL